MYHYVRDFDNTSFKGIKGMTIEEFEKQLIYLKKNYSIVHPEEILRDNFELSKNQVLLTFDDGYKEHYDYVFPILKRHRLSAIFFIPTSILNGSNLYVNKIQHVLASTSIETLYSRLIEILSTKLIKSQLDELIIKFNNKSRFDDAKTVFFKKVLQHALDRSIRETIIDELFEEYLNISELEFYNYLYLNEHHIKEMQFDGMVFGAHTFTHPHLSTLSFNEQKYEIEKSIADLEASGVNRTFFCYPYGSYNEQTISILQDLKVKYAFTTKPEECSSLRHNYEIPRLDCNDILIEQK